ncbi:YqjF family protein [Alkalicoccus saliphilus]|jgi:uncharacterized protein|uniref:DUF2071 domain-containing protein n=1 Tax=Alkalicoccus saliphilus TaxID=200989 RepID=A0A2T4U353_9BACI|nr:DUF2071 domain-containing protein [Alkalicoccus saliphilus]PTL37828.1 hypothetical protein C6Y45_14525 [Alkalicoccus saliphilus]
MKQPKRPWIATQTWEDLLLIHWPVQPDALKIFIPPPLELDTFQGQAWIGVVPFLGTHNEARWMGRNLSIQPFLELNVRTYVKYKGEHGVFFITMDADSMLAVRGARTVAGLPYFHARMERQKNKGLIHYVSQRNHRGQPKVNFEADFAPLSAPFYSKAGTLSHWLTERYSLLKAEKNKVTAGPIYHDPWDLQEAKLHIYQNELLHFLPRSVTRQKPLVHYCRSKKVLFYPFKKMN